MRDRVFGLSQLKLTYITSKTFLILPPSRETVYHTHTANDGPTLTDSKRRRQLRVSADSFETKATLSTASHSINQNKRRADGGIT